MPGASSGTRRDILAGLGAGSILLLAMPVHANTRAQRIVCAGGDVCEIVYALGYGGKIIAGDLASRYTPGSERFAKLGQRRKLSAEGILALRPDLFIYADDAGPPSTIQHIRAAGIRSVAIPQLHSIAGIADKIALIAAALGREEQGYALTARLKADFADTAKVLATLPRAGRRRVLFTHSVTGGKLSGAAGAGTPAHVIIGLAGGINALAAVQGYKPASAEAIVAAAPDVVLMAKRLDGKAISPRDVFAIPALAATPAGRARRLLVLEGTFMLGFGPRTVHAVRSLAKSLYPSLRFPASRYT